MSKITNLNKNERRAFLYNSERVSDFLRGQSENHGKPIPASTQRDRTERRRQSWIADADNDRHTKALKIFRRRNK